MTTPTPAALRQAVVVNVSRGYYNLGAHKLFDWLQAQDYQVDYFDGDPGLFLPTCDLLALSVIFSWHAPIARDITMRVLGRSEVWCGGPGMFALGKWWKQETGLDCQHGLDSRFERQRGAYRMTFASRGCPVNCYFCIVPRLEGTDFTLDWDFQPAPILCDNNLSALPAEFQCHIIARYRETQTQLIDANSGFEPRTFDREVYLRWKPLLRGPWRFAFDTLDEEQWVKPMMEILSEVPPSRKRVYCLIGNEPIAACQERARKIIAWHGEPYCQPYTLLNALRREDYKIAFDWTVERLKDFARYYNRWLYRTVPLAEYKPRRNMSATFAGMSL